VMGVQAFLTPMGRGLPLKEAFEDEAAWEAACREEEAILRWLERILEAQLGERVHLVGTVLDGTRSPRGELSDRELGETVGGTDGIAPLQALVVSYLLDGRLPETWRPFDLYEPSRRARDATNRESLRRFLHLVEHDPVTGFYLPIDFPDPIWLPGELHRESYEISVGSAVKLLDDLQQWSKLAADLPGVPGWMILHAENLALVARAALRTGLALELA
jgi:hypothetical protein